MASFRDLDDDASFDGDGSPLDDDETGELVEDAVEAYCPYCGEPVVVFVDAGGGARQQYVEDCSVCCQPWVVRVEIGAHGAVSIDLRASD